MTRCQIQPRDWIFVKDYGFLSFARNKNLSSKYSQNRLDYAKQFATDTLEIASKRVIQKTGEATGDATRNKVANKSTRISKLHHIII